MVNTFIKCMSKEDNIEKIRKLVLPFQDQGLLNFEILLLFLHFCQPLWHQTVDIEAPQICI